MVTIKSPAEIESMKKAGAIVRDVLNLMRDSVRPGVTTGHLDKLAYDYIRSQHAVPSFLHYNGFPASICASVNEQVVHGIPSDRRLEEGDIVGIDVGAVFDGFHGDAYLRLAARHDLCGRADRRGDAPADRRDRAVLL